MCFCCFPFYLGEIDIGALLPLERLWVTEHLCLFGEWMGVVIPFSGCWKAQTLRALWIYLVTSISPWVMDSFLILEDSFGFLLCVAQDRNLYSGSRVMYAWEARHTKKGALGYPSIEYSFPRLSGCVWKEVSALWASWAVWAYLVPLRLPVLYPSSPHSRSGGSPITGPSSPWAPLLLRHNLIDCALSSFSSLCRILKFYSTDLSLWTGATVCSICTVMAYE